MSHLTADEVAALTDEEVLAKTCRGQMGPGMVGHALHARALEIMHAGGIPEIDYHGIYKKGLPPGATKNHGASKVHHLRATRRRGGRR